MSDYDGPYRHITITIRETANGLLTSGALFEVRKGQRKYVSMLWSRELDAPTRPETAAGILRLAADTLDPPAGA